MWQVLPFLAVLLLPVSAAPFQGFQAVEDCKAATYGLPGFRSSRNLFPPKDILWDGVDKVAFQNVESTWLAGNFRDTGSAFVVVLFGGAIQHKEYWPEPNLMRTLAVNHGISSLAVDIAGRGESCGTEAVLNYTSAVRELMHFLANRKLRMLSHTHVERAAPRHGCCRSLCEQSSWSICWSTFW